MTNLCQQWTKSSNTKAKMKKVSIIISNRNDLEMLSITVRSCIEELRPVGHENSEIVICDNSDQSTFDLLPSVIPSKYIKEGLVKIVRQNFPCLFTAREKAIENALGKYILCIDSHMIIGRNMIFDLVNFMDIYRHEDETTGFCHAPINWAHQHECRSKHDRDVSVNELGDWNLAYLHPRTITWKGMPWICKRDWFLNTLKGYGALAIHKVSWGGGDMHLGVKAWLLGYKNWAVPTNPGIHIGPYPKIDKGKDKNVVKIGKYRLYTASGQGPHTVGFLVSCYVLGGESMMRRNKEAITERFGRFIDVDKYWNQAIKWGESEKRWLDKNKVMSFEEFLELKPWEDNLNEVPNLRTQRIHRQISV